MSMSKSFKYPFPEEICHLHWIQKHMTSIEESALEKTANYIEYLKQLLEKDLRRNGKFSGDGDGGNEDEDTLDGESFRTPLGKMAQQLNMAAFSIYVGRFSFAAEYLQEAYKAICNLEKSETIRLQQQQLKAIKYCSNVLTSTLLALLKLDERATHDEAQIIIILQSKDFSKKWNSLQSNGQSQATLIFLEGILVNSLKGKLAVMGEIYVKASRLDPDCPLWHHYAYTKLNLIRRSRLAKPQRLDDQEKERCQKAYELSPNYLPIALNYAKHLKESFWAEEDSWWTGHPWEIQECIQTFREALRMAEEQVAEDEGTFWLGRVKLLFGEFLVFGKGPDFDQALGKQLLEECLEMHPNSVYILHKVAKLQYWGAFGTKLFKDLTKAEGNYLRVLKRKGSPPSFNCLVEYMRVLIDLQRPVEQIITVIDEFLEVCTRDEYVARLKMERGCIQFVYGLLREEAICRGWVQVLVEFPNYTNQAFAAFKRRYKAENEQASYVYKPRVVQILSKLKDELGAGTYAGREAQLEALSSLSEELIKQEKERKGRRRNRNDNGLFESLVGLQLEPLSLVCHQEGRRRRGGNTPDSPQSNVISLADQVAEWRRNNNN